MKRIRNIAFIAALTALLAPVGTFAQSMPQPPPDVRAKIEAMRAQYKTAAFNDLSADHRAKVQALIDQVQSGSLDPRDASTQIDAVLSPAETQAVLAEAQKMRDAMHQAFSPPGGSTDQPPHRDGMMNRKPDAGRFLLMLSHTH
jgi:hypothetical protein